MKAKRVESSPDTSRKFKKNITPKHITWTHIMPCGVYGSPAVRLKRVDFPRSVLRLVDQHPSV